MDESLHRRRNPRLMLGITAEFISLEGRQPVTLQDLSATGAKIQLGGLQPSKRGILRWMEFEVLAEVKWRREGWCGLIFDRPISNACLFQTRINAPGLIAEEQRNRHSHARDFVSGR